MLTDHLLHLYTNQLLYSVLFFKYVRKSNKDMYFILLFLQC